MKYARIDNDSKITTYYATMDDVKAIHEAIVDSLSCIYVKKQLDNGYSIYINRKTGAIAIERGNDYCDAVEFTGIHTYHSGKGAVHISTSNIDNDDAWIISIQYYPKMEAQN